MPWHRYAAQGLDGRRQPWGNSTGAVPLILRRPAPELCDRTCQTAGQKSDPTPADVDSHPLGASPFGVEDLVGNVWQYTDVFEDEHTRAVVLRGGSRYQPARVEDASKWYFPAVASLEQHGKYLLMDDAYERAATIGFRCVMDAAVAAAE